MANKQIINSFKPVCLVIVIRFFLSTAIFVSVWIATIASFLKGLVLQSVIVYDMTK